MSSLENQSLWYEFLDLYRENTCLWDIYSDTYMRRDLRNAAYRVLLEKYREITPSATLDMVKRKIDIFRTGYRREIRKINESKLNSLEEYKPTLWYFDKLSFLDFQGDSNEIKECDDSDEQAVEYIEIPQEYPDPVVKYRLKKKKLDTNPRPRPRPRLKEGDDRHERKRHASPVCESNNVSYDLAEDESTTYCANLKLQMRELDTQQKFIAEKLISDVIFLARTSQLTLDSSILIASSDKC